MSYVEYHIYVYTSTSTTIENEAGDITLFVIIEGSLVRVNPHLDIHPYK
jgi:hypothetical protein